MRMIIAKAHLKSIAPYGQNGFFKMDKLEKESANDFELRTWRERGHWDKDDNMFIPPMALKKCLDDSAKYLGLQVPGKGKSTFTKHFESGIMVTEGPILNVKKDKVLGHWQLVPSNGIDGPKVEKCFPYIPEWKAVAQYTILDATVTRPVFEKVLEAAGVFIGLGWFRARNGGLWGRFVVEKVEWEEVGS